MVNLVIGTQKQISVVLLTKTNKTPQMWGLFSLLKKYIVMYYDKFMGYYVFTYINTKIENGAFITNLKYYKQCKQ